MHICGIYKNGTCCAQSCLTLCNPMDCSLPRSYVHGDSPGKNNGVSCHALVQEIFPTQGSNSEFEPRSPTLQADCLPSEPPWKLKNTGVGSVSLLQRIFPTQLSYQGSPENGIDDPIYKAEIEIQMERTTIWITRGVE